VSDERDSADAAGEGDDATTGSQPAVVRPSRPSGKRSRGRSSATALAEPEEVESTAVELGVTDDESDEDGKKAGKKAKKAKEKKPAKKPGAKKGASSSRNPFVYIWTYLTQVVAELRKVIWPNRKQMVTYTTVVLLFLAFMVALIGGIDLGLAKLVLLVFG
jgi:preprotein translocase subunit SecE